MKPSRTTTTTSTASQPGSRGPQAVCTGALNGAAQTAPQLPPLCYIRHPTTGETIEIRRDEDGWRPANTQCSPECLNAKLPHPPTPAEILAMKHGSIMGWNSPGTDPALWTRSVEAGATGVD